MSKAHPQTAEGLAAAAQRIAKELQQARDKIARSAANAGDDLAAELRRLQDDLAAIQQTIAGLGKGSPHFPGRGGSIAPARVDSEGDPEEAGSGRSGWRRVARASNHGVDGGRDLDHERRSWRWRRPRGSGVREGGIGGPRPGRVAWHGTQR